MEARNSSPTVGTSIITGEFINATGTYETIRVHHGKAFHASDHIARAFGSSHALGIMPPVAESVIAMQIARTIEAGNLRDAVIYLCIATEIDGLKCVREGAHVPFIVITCNPYIPKPAAWYSAGMHLTIRKFTRKRPEIKDLSQRRKKMQLREDSPFDDVLIENSKGQITESTQCNVFIVKNNTLITPATGMLPGVTRGVVLELAKPLMPITPRSLSKDDIITADECFLTGTLHNVVPVTKIDNKSLGDGKVGQWTKKIMKAFATEFDG